MIFEKFLMLNYFDRCILTKYHLFYYSTKPWKYPYQPIPVK